MTESPGIDITVPHPARVYDYWLGGKDNYRADREAEPGVVQISRWRPESDPGTGAAPLWGGVARKP